MNRVLIFALVCSLVAWLICPLRIGVVLGSSMSPALRNHQVIVINCGYYRKHAVAKGDIVVFDRGHELLVKRVSAVGGQRVWELRDPSVGSYQVVGASRVPHLRRTVRQYPEIGMLRCVDVPAGYVYVQGDSPTALDSRSFGPVPERAIRGRVVGAPSLY